MSGIEPTAVISDSSISIWELIQNDYIIVCDTNVFLGLYRYSPDYANFALECLQSIKGQLMIPYTVKIEYEKHYRTLYKKRQHSIEDSIDAPMKLIELQRSKLNNSFSRLITLQYPDVEEMQVQIDEKYDELKNMLTSYFEERSVLSLIQDSWESDLVYELIKELYADRQIMRDFPRDEIYKICEEGQQRYTDKRPPGYKDAKNKDGIRKYSDLILWKEIIRFAKDEQKNIIFVTDDVKPDWWRTDNDSYEFLPELIEEFKRGTQIKSTAKGGGARVPMKIVPFVSADFYKAVSESMDVPKSDAVDQALQITDDDYIDSIVYQISDSLEETLRYSGFSYVDETILTSSGSEGIDEWETYNINYSSYSKVERDGDSIIYELIYDVEMSGSSSDYWGRDSDTKEIITSPPYSHVVQGEITVRVVRTVDLFMDFMNSAEFDSFEIISGDFTEISYTSAMQQDFEREFEEVPDAYSTCPDCGTPINLENDGGNGFCSNCALNH